MSFGNPLGFLALAGIPAVLFIHLLQVRSRRVQVTTLFLLEPRAFEREGGRKIERLRTSLLLWLQLLAVVAATWLLVETRWFQEDTTLRGVLVVPRAAGAPHGARAAGPAGRSSAPLSVALRGRRAL